MCIRGGSHDQGGGRGRQCSAGEGRESGRGPLRPHGRAALGPHTAQEHTHPEDGHPSQQGPGRRMGGGRRGQGPILPPRHQGRVHAYRPGGRLPPAPAAREGHEERGEGDITSRVRRDAVHLPDHRADAPGRRQGGAAQGRIRREQRGGTSPTGACGKDARPHREEVRAARNRGLRTDHQAAIPPARLIDDLRVARSRKGDGPRTGGRRHPEADGEWHHHRHHGHAARTLVLASDAPGGVRVTGDRRNISSLPGREGRTAIADGDRS